MAKPTRASDSFIDSAFGFIGTRNPTPQEIGGLSADVFNKRYRELCAVLDLKQFANALMCWLRVNAPLDVELSIPDQLAWAEYATVTLLERGVIKPVVETPESRADIDKLRIAVGKSGLRPAPEAEVAAEPQPPVIDPTEQCARDYLVMPSQEFRKVWMTGANRAVYDQAAVTDGPIDQAVRASQSHQGIGRA